MQVTSPRRRAALVITSLVLVTLLSGARHRVRKHDSFESVAETYGVTTAELRAANPGVNKLVAGEVITVPESPPRHVWSPAHPYAPPVPTVGQLVTEMKAGTVITAPDPGRPGVLVMYAGVNQDAEIGELRPRRPGEGYDVLLYPETGQGGGASAAGGGPIPPPTRLGRTPYRPTPLAPPGTRRPGSSPGTSKCGVGRRR
jgi:LysM repeat protein